MRGSILMPNGEELKSQRCVPDQLNAKRKAGSFYGAINQISGINSKMSGTSPSHKRYTEKCISPFRITQTFQKQEIKNFEKLTTSKRIVVCINKDLLETINLNPRKTVKNNFI